MLAALAAGRLLVQHRRAAVHELSTFILRFPSLVVRRPLASVAPARRASRIDPMSAPTGQSIGSQSFASSENPGQLPGPPNPLNSRTNS